MKNKIFIALLAFIMSPVAFLYLSRIRLALIYLVALLTTGVLDYHLQINYGKSGVGLALALVAIIHSVSLASSQNEKGNPKFYNYWWGALSIPFALFTGILMVRSFLYEPFIIPSESMSPNLNAGDHILIEKLGYGTYGTLGVTVLDTKNPSSKPNAGEIFVLNPPNMKYAYIERIIGLPGDHVSLNDKTLSINSIIVSKEIDSQIVQESLGEEVYEVTYAIRKSGYRNFEGVVPEGHYFVMGDNRNNSSDSRSWGFVSESDLIGRVVKKW